MGREEGGECSRERIVEWNWRKGGEKLILNRSLTVPFYRKDKHLVSLADPDTQIGGTSM